MKRFLKSSLSIFLAITIIFSSAVVGLNEIDFGSLFAVKAEAAYSGKCGENLTWELDDNGILTISGTGDMNDYSNVSSVPWYSVISSVKKVVINSGATSIGDNAFCECKNLSSITISDNVTSIGNNAFVRCNLMSITIPNSVKSIGSFAFGQCENLLKITLLDGLDSIGDWAFRNCSKLTTITIPNSVMSIGVEAFADCNRLVSINVDSKNINYSSVDGVLFNKNKTTLIQYPEGKTETSYIIPENVTYIGDYAFTNCRFRTITIPTSVTTIGDYAFYCGNIRSIIIPDSVTSIGETAFVGCLELKSIDVGSGNLYYESIAGVLFNEDKTTLMHYPAGKTKKSYTIPDSVTTIGAYAFYNVENSLNSITIPDSVKSIGKCAFSCYGSIRYVFYKGTLDEWVIITIGYDNAVLTDAYIHFESTGHSSPSWTISKEATVNKAGSKYKECTQCGMVYETATIPQLKAAKPKLSKIENTSSGVKITWGKVSGADKYRVYRKTSKGDWKYIATTSKTYYTDKTAKSGTKYYYAVKSQNEAGNSSLSSSLSKYYLADPNLKTPSSTSKGVVLKWNKITGASGYYVYRKTSSGSYKKIATVKGKTKVTYTDKSAKKGKTYTYKVKAYYSKTYSAYSNTQKIKDKY